MNTKLQNLINQLSPTEQQRLIKHLEREYELKFKGSNMLRDDIKDKVVEIIKADFAEPSFVVQEHNTWVDLNLDAVDVVGLSEVLLKEFELEEIPFSRVMGWETVSDVIGTIEDYLECALHDREG